MCPKEASRAGLDIAYFPRCLVVENILCDVDQTVWHIHSGDDQACNEAWN